jgi:hypothetical protein
MMMMAPLVCPASYLSLEAVEIVGNRFPTLFGSVLNPIEI